MSAQTAISVLSALTALGAVIVGPFITARAARNGMLGPMRQAWINSLRDTIAEYLAAIAVGKLQTSAQLSADDKIRLAAEDARKEHLSTTFELKEKIHLLSNAYETEHKELCRMVDRAFNAYEQFKDTSIPLRELRRWSQAVIKKEWESVKGNDKYELKLPE